MSAVHPDYDSAVDAAEAFQTEVLALAKKHNITAFVCGTEIHFVPTDETSGRSLSSVGKGTPTEIAFIASSLYGSARRDLDVALGRAIAEGERAKRSR